MAQPRGSMLVPFKLPLSSCCCKKPHLRTLLAQRPYHTERQSHSANQSTGIQRRPQPARSSLLISPPHRSLHRYAKGVRSNVPSPFDDKEHPIDEAIGTMHVHLVKDDGEIVRNQPLRSVLRSIEDRERYVVRCVSYEQKVPVTKIVAKKELFEQYKLKAMRAQRNKQNAPEKEKKEMELNWGIDREGDLKHRMRRLEEWLRERRTVEVLMGSKKGSRKTSPEEMHELLATIRETANLVEGAYESKEMEGHVGGRAVLTFKVREKDGEKPRGTEASRLDRTEKMAKKQALKEERRAEEERKQKRREEERLKARQILQ